MERISQSILHSSAQRFVESMGSAALLPSILRVLATHALDASCRARSAHTYMKKAAVA